MARITSTRITNYRSIGEPIEITWPPNKPVVLLGQNNAGKSNVVKAYELVLGNFWPGNHEPEDHECFERNRNNPIEILVRFSQTERLGGRHAEIIWRYDVNLPESPYFRGRPVPGGSDGYIRGDDRDSCICIVLEAERNLRYHLGYSSKWTYLSRLMHRFHRALTNHENTKGQLEELFAGVKQRFGEIPEFANFVRELKGQLAGLISSMTHKLEVDFEAYNPVNFFHALRLQAAEGDQPRTLEEMGTGEQQVLAMAFAYAYARAFHEGVVLIVEEPEAHLHPLAQQWLAKRMNAMAAEGLQILVTTHSAAFVDMINLDGLVLVRRVGGSTKTVQIRREQLVARCIAMGVPPDRITPENILPFYAANATREIMEGFFAQVVLLVEGPTEALALPIYLAKRNLDVVKMGIAMIPVYGKGSLGKWWRLFITYGIPCYVIFDNDGHDDPTGTKRRDALRAMGIAVAQHAEYLAVNDWTIEADLMVFGSDFETILRQSFPNYAALEAQAAEQGIDAKPFIARWVAEHMPVDEAHAGWQRFGDLAERLRAKLPAAG
jgi:putative ATP-dependent endonuclease of the OLD family